MLHVFDAKRKELLSTYWFLFAEESFVILHYYLRRSRVANLYLLATVYVKKTIDWRRNKTESRSWFKLSPLVLQCSFARLYSPFFFYSVFMHFCKSSLLFHMHELAVVIPYFFSVSRDDSHLWVTLIKVSRYSVHLPYVHRSNELTRDLGNKLISHARQSTR